MMSFTSQQKKICGIDRITETMPYIYICPCRYPFTEFAKRNINNIRHKDEAAKIKINQPNTIK